MEDQKKKRKITDIRGDYGTHILKCVNDKLENIAMDIAEKVTGETECVFPYDTFVDCFSDLKTYIKQSAQIYSRKYMGLKSNGHYDLSKGKFNIYGDYPYVISDSNGCMKYTIEFGLKNVSVSPGYKYTFWFHYKTLKIDFDKMVEEFGEPTERSKYFDVNGNEIEINDEVIWTNVSYPKLCTNLVKKIKDNVFTFDDGKTLRVNPNEKHNNIYILGCCDNRLKWSGIEC